MRRWLVCLALIAGCGGGGDPIAEAILRAGEGVRAVNRTMALTTVLYGPSTISVIAPYETIAQSIRGRFLSETGSCAMIGGTGATATLTLPTGGCTLASAGMKAAGTLSCTVKKGPDPYLQIACTLDLVVDALPLKGTLDVFTELGNDYTFAVTLESGRADRPTDPVITYMPTLNAGVAAQAAELTGNATIDGLIMAVAGVKQGFSRCYPESGAMALLGGVLTFSQTTPQTGEAVFTQDRASKTVKLLERPGCPPAQ